MTHLPSDSDNEETVSSSGEEEEFEEESEEDNEDGHDGEPVSKKAKTNKGDLYKAPTNDEINQLKETENLFHSSLFRMQITELITEVTLKPKKCISIDEYVKQLTTLVTGITDNISFELNNDKWLRKKKLSLPLHSDSKLEFKGKFIFSPPKTMKVIGAYALGTAMKPHPCVDLAVEIPKVFVGTKDHLNMRYLRKRALYLAVLAHYLSKSDLVEDLQYEYLNSNIMKPILVFKPKGKLKGITIRLHTCMEEGCFKLSRFHPNKNNVRSKWFQGESVPEGDTESTDPGTPHYNTLMAQEMTTFHSLDTADDVIGHSEAIKHGIVLLKVWLRQRQLDQGYGGFSGHILTMYVVYLLKKRRLNILMSSYQIFRNTLLNLAKEDWTSGGISISSDNAADANRPVLSEFTAVYDVVFVDASGFVNLCADMNKTQFKAVKHEASLALRTLETPGIDSFEMLLIRKVPFIQKYDQVFHITNLDQQLTGATEKLVTDKFEMTDRCGDILGACLPKVLTLLETTLSSRVNVVGITPVMSKKWYINEPPPHIACNDSLTLGVLVNPETCNSVLEKGPAADSEQAEEFREFWGGMSELRRFQDGSICEAVVWQGKTQADTRNVMSKIIKHILKRHVHINPDTVKCIHNSLDPLLKISQPPKWKQNKKPLLYGTGEEQHSDVVRSFDALCKNLRALKDLPLTINTIQGLSPVFRFAEVFPPLPCPMKVKIKDLTRLEPQPDKKAPPYVHIIQVQCVLEASGKWPEDKEAVQRVKAAFHLTLASELSKNCKLSVVPYPGYIDVLKDGYVFRIGIGYMREISLLRMETGEGGILKMVDNEASQALEKKLVHLPKLNSTLHGLHQQHSSYTSTVRLAKRWIASHMLLGHYISEEAVELLIAHVFIHPAPFDTPNAPMVGFLRFLSLLSIHDWNSTPLIVNLNQGFTKEDIVEVQNAFTRDRATLPLMFIATPGDKTSALWTKRTPNAQILQRIVLLARESLEVLSSQMENPEKVDIKQIFRPPLDPYDIILELNPKQVPRAHEAVDPGENYYWSHDGAESSGNKPLPVVDYDPVQYYLMELRDSYGEHALFFHDIYGGNVVTVLWKPQALASHEFKVSHINSSMIDSNHSGKKAHLTTNIDAIIEDFKTIGHGLVNSIQVKNKS